MKFFDHLNYYELHYKIYPVVFFKSFTCSVVIIFASLTSLFRLLPNKKAEKASDKEPGVTIEEIWECARLEGFSKCPNSIVAT